MKLRITSPKIDKLRKVKESATASAARAQAEKSAYAPEHYERAKNANASFQEAVAPLRPPVEAALEAVNGKALSFTIAAFAEVIEIALEAEERLAAKGIKKANRVGTVVKYRPAGPSANGYRYAAATTFLTLERTTGGWWLTAVERDTVQPKQSECFDLIITPAAHDDVIRAAMAGLRVAETAESKAA